LEIDIDDPNSMRVVNKLPFDDSKDKRTIRELGKMNKAEIDNNIKENKGKTIIFVGFFS
jgi:hypothetical protein